MKTRLLLVALVLYCTPLFAEPNRILCRHSTITVLADTQALSDVV
ncbi:hypothetical protein [Geomonas oryzisoli]|nr:hypothetical protein [Geomonas oryzisoli]